MAVVMASDEGKKVTLISSDGEGFLVEEAVVMVSQTIRHVIEDVPEVNVIPLPKVNSEILSKVIEYCKKHVDSAAEEDLKGWDSNFVKVDQTKLFGLILAANYLNIKGLLHFTCQTAADMIKGKTPKEIRKYFNIKETPIVVTPEELKRALMRMKVKTPKEIPKRVFTPEENEEFRRENEWAFN